MKNLLLLIFTIFTTTLLAQKPDSQKILEEGRKLYKLEKASWIATDHFLENYPDRRTEIKGYLSYIADDGILKNIFYDKSERVRILARYRFDKQVEIISVDTTGKIPSEKERNLIAIRQNALSTLEANADNFFQYYEKTSFNLIPLIEENKKQVYILTASQESGEVLLGNDYQLDFDDANQLKNKKKIHKSLIELPLKGVEGDALSSTLHSHVVSSVINPTDICTLLLYKDYTEWKQHYVVHKKHVSIFDLEKEMLIIMKKKNFDKIAK